MLCVSFWVQGGAQKTSSIALAHFIREKGDSLHKSSKVPGIYVGIINEGKKQFFNFGYSVPDEKLPFDSAAVFEAGSITKTFTAFIVESILQQKRLSDTTSIISYLPDSVQANKALSSITFLSLMNHTSGLPRLPDNLALNSKAPYDTYTINNLYSYLKRATPKPDGKSNYSNLGMGLAGILAQQISGKSYSTLINEYILLPFGMRKKEANAQHKSQGYFGDEKAPFWNMDALAPAGALQCTADEMLSYLAYMSNPRKAKAKAIIAILLQPTVIINKNMQVARAWHTIEQKGKPRIYWHNGGTYGFSTFAAFVKETGQAVIVVVNKFDANAVSDGLGIAVLKKMLE